MGATRLCPSLFRPWLISNELGCYVFHTRLNLLCSRVTCISHEFATQSTEKWIKCFLCDDYNILIWDLLGPGHTDSELLTATDCRSHRSSDQTGYKLDRNQVDAWRPPHHIRVASHVHGDLTQDINARTHEICVYDPGMENHGDRKRKKTARERERGESERRMEGQN